MSEEHSTNEEAIYYAAIAKPQDEREAYLRQVCGRDAALLARVEVLLRAREVNDGFLVNRFRSVHPRQLCDLML